ncbi:efflux RND transporter periplasmic adaptor subunit [Ensifer adhaerens]|uniref:HlyD family secretion protein n=1 Tax=Ensifer adhaerens TaxID=106592 RepID=UPI001CC0F1D9|nr:efflux RND transporter periplasmic adaptor subunit [Ensifer adhaerens]MBZ7922230.1 efflux RND transporter periplasmic adaptor subunit [Ensifer adhaerens]UAX90876.1 efflux RND transporter periplasmic adaptor subunit [Ensifer adhaerens]UAX98505.1 efflux RND transporter periplasmic adaptor subunit [Ensifer adhaerens]UAY05886.1 efflux RND transporter periplasmic adaptor subunit [Ensifer adhaerens]
MIVVLLNVYLAILFCLVKFRIVTFNLFWKVSPAIVFLLLLIGLFIPMNWGAPQGKALVVRNSVAIVPDVAGEVLEVAVASNSPLKAGDVLFRIDPVPYKAKVDALQAQLSLQELRLSQMTKLQSRDAATEFDVQQRQADVDNLKAQITNAKWDLDKTTVRAPADGYVTNLALRKGARVATLPLSPAMAFIDTSETIIGVEINQIDARYIEPGQRVEATFKFAPGETYTGTVEGVLQAIASGQARVSGTAVTPEAVAAAPFVVRVKLDDQAFAARLPAGAAGDAAIFTDRVKAAHVIRRVLLRQIAITNYINPF